MCPDWELNRRPFGFQAGAQSTEPHQPGGDTIENIILKLLNNAPGDQQEPQSGRPGIIDANPHDHTRACRLRAQMPTSLVSSDVWVQAPGSHQP